MGSSPIQNRLEDIQFMVRISLKRSNDHKDTTSYLFKNNKIYIFFFNVALGWPDQPQGPLFSHGGGFGHPKPVDLGWQKLHNGQTMARWVVWPPPRATKPPQTNQLGVLDATPMALVGRSVTPQILIVLF
jgi:hypothetical protein